MKVELFIARKLKLGNQSGSNSPSLNVAALGIVLAVVIMILSVVIVSGFKNEITQKIYALNSHLKVTNAALGIDDNYSTVDAHDVSRAIQADSLLAGQLASVSLVAEKPAILKTDNDFKAVVYRGVDSGFDWTYLSQSLTDGRVPNLDRGGDEREIAISKTLANQLQLKVGDKIFTYFIDNEVKVRRSIIVGIYNTNFETFDKQYIMGNISLLQGVNGWNGFTGNYVGVTLRDPHSVPLDTVGYRLYGDLASYNYAHNSPTLYRVSQIENNNQSFFTWLGMLDMNVVIIITLMMIVSTFTLVAALLMIVLERIRMVGLLKSLGASNGAIKRIFIYLTTKLILRSLLIGNVVAIGMAVLQDKFHIVGLNAEAYYVSWVPVLIDVPTLALLDVGILVISYVTLLAPSHIVSTIKPSSTINFE